MTEKDKIFAEVHVLLEQQIETLRMRLLGPDEIRQYGERQKRIDALVERIGQSRVDASAN